MYRRLNIKKIVYLDLSPIFSGAEASLVSLIKYLDRTQFEPIICFPFPQDHHVRYNSCNCRLHYLSDGPKWWMGSDRWKRPIRGTDFIKRFILSFRLAVFAYRNNIRILHINLMKPDTFWWIFWCRLFRIKIVAHVRSDYPEWMPGATLQKLCHATICVSKYVKGIIDTRYTSDHTFVIHDPVDPDEFSPSLSKAEAKRILKIPDNQKIISSVGLLYPHKGHDIAIYVFEKIATLHPDLRLIVAGGGSEDELQRLKCIVERLNLCDKVIFTGSQVENVKIIYLASEFVFSLTNRGEAFGRVPLEAGLCERPVIAPNIGASLELIRDKETGFLVVPKSRDVIFSTAKLLMDDPQLGKTIGEKARVYIIEHFSPEIHANKVQELYATLIN
jgi:glycosyltransferase involved in cell wall biosynthesis